MDLRDYFGFATQTAHEAGRLTLGYFRTGTMRPELKPDDTPVTAADREAKRLIRTKMWDEVPRHAVVGEMYEAEEGTEPPLAR